MFVRHSVRPVGFASMPRQNYSAYGYHCDFLGGRPALWRNATRHTFDRTRPEGSFMLRAEITADENAFGGGK